MRDGIGLLTSYRSLRCSCGSWDITLSPLVRIYRDETSKSQLRAADVESPKLHSICSSIAGLPKTSGSPERGLRLLTRRRFPPSEQRSLYPQLGSISHRLESPEMFSPGSAGRYGHPAINSSSRRNLPQPQRSSTNRSEPPESENKLS